MSWPAAGIGAFLLAAATGCGGNAERPPAPSQVQFPAEAWAASDSSQRIVCYFPENCYRLSTADSVPLVVPHAALAGKVLVQFLVDSTLRIRQGQIACARLRWKKSGKAYAASCQSLTVQQRHNLLALTIPLIRELRFSFSRPNRAGCQLESWTMPVIFR